MDEHEARDRAWLRLDEALAVQRWRTERLLGLGYGVSEAAQLALSGIDLHELERLIGLGLSTRDRRPDRGVSSHAPTRVR